MTLEDLILSVGAQIDAGRAARCPVCREDSLVVAGCEACGSELG